MLLQPLPALVNRIYLAIENKHELFVREPYLQQSGQKQFIRRQLKVFANAGYEPRMHQVQESKDVLLLLLRQFFHDQSAGFQFFQQIQSLHTGILAYLLVFGRQEEYFPVQLRYPILVHFLLQSALFLHIGNGASACAVKNGVCVETSMGLTPLEGLVMGTRSGDLDPAIIPYICNSTGLTAKEMDTYLNKKSGLVGICGKSDRRDVHEAANNGDKRAALGVAMETHRIKKYIGAYAALLGRVDAIVFTAGVGEMGEHIRRGACEGLENLGIMLDEEKNNLSHCRNAETCISKDESPVKIFVIPTDEELVITEDAYALMNGTYDIHTNFHYTFESPDYVNKARARGLKENLKKKPELERIIALPPGKTSCSVSGC